MSKRTPSNSTTRFSGRADAYDRFRPHYPADVVAFLRDAIGLTPEKTVADIGSGTGISAELFLNNGNTVFCVEPNEAMRRKAEERFSRMRGFISVNGTADRTGLPDRSVDMIFIAQAFHWFDRQKCRTEFLRIGRTECRTVITWNDRRLGTPFETAYEDFLRRFGTDYPAIDHRNITEDDLNTWYGKRGCAKMVFRFTQQLGIEDLRGRLLSVSYVPAPGEKGFDEMMNDLGLLFEKYQEDGKVSLGYETRLYYGQLE